MAIDWNNLIKIGGNLANTTLQGVANYQVAKKGNNVSLVSGSASSLSPDSLQMILGNSNSGNTGVTGNGISDVSVWKSNIYLRYGLIGGGAIVLILILLKAFKII